MILTLLLHPAHRLSSSFQICPVDNSRVVDVECLKDLRIDELALQLVNHFKRLLRVLAHLLARVVQAVVRSHVLRSEVVLWISSIEFFAVGIIGKLLFFVLFLVFLLVLFLLFFLLLLLDDSSVVGGRSVLVIDY